MLQALVITLREGLEAFLIVAITLAYLRQTGRNALVPVVFWAVGVAVVASGVAGYFFGQAENQPLWEGMLAVVAAVLVVTMIVYMLRMARHMRAEIGRKLERATETPGMGAIIGVFAFVLLMIVREGMETALLLSSVLFQSGMQDMAAGAVAGVLLAATLAWGWSRFGSRIRLDRFFQVTAVFLTLFALQLLLLAFHEFTEAELLPIDNTYWHLATESWAEGSYAQWISASMLILPLTWFVFMVARERMQQRIEAQAA